MQNYLLVVTNTRTGNEVRRELLHPSEVAEAMPRLGMMMKESGNTLNVELLPTNRHIRFTEYDVFYVLGAESANFCVHPLIRDDGEMTHVPVEICYSDSVAHCDYAHVKPTLFPVEMMGERAGPYKEHGEEQ